jgi:N-acetylglucosaminyldiphosphoundecaprenol N-acetyl-beta-D-mannosaminyltransferase
MASSSKSVQGDPHAGTARIAGLDFDSLSEQQVVTRVVESLDQHQGGLIATVNIDICHQISHDQAAYDLVQDASLVVADGMPLVWAARLSGQPLPERVTGSSLIFALSAAAAQHGRSVYLLGGEPGVPERAAAELTRRFSDLKVAGTDSPPVGFDTRSDELAEVASRVAAARPDIVFAGLGFPKQERVIAQIAPGLPGTWFIGCGAAIPFAAGVLPRAPRWMQQAGLEWVHRLISEPRRLYRRYLGNDLLFAVRLLIASAAARPGRQETASGQAPARRSAEPRG